MILIGNSLIFSLRIAQSFFAALILILAIPTANVYLFSVFRLLSAASFIQMIWGISMCFYDLYVKRNVKRNLKRSLDSGILTALVITDLVVGGIMCAAATSSAATMVYLAWDTDRCSFMPYECRMGVAVVVLGFCGWVCDAITALCLFWIRASL